MVTEPIRAVNHIPGDFQKPIKLEILSTGASVTVASMIVVGFMRICG